MLLTFLRAFGLIFIAEMGDKTQILAMAFSTKYKVRNVIIGVFIGSTLNHALAVLLGANLHLLIPLNTLSIIAGFSFILFGLWSLKFNNEESNSKISKYGPILTVAIAFFIGELGDKTQLAAIALSTDSVYPLLTLLGTVSGMVFTSLLAIFVGIKIGGKISEFYMKLGAGIVFLSFGYIKLFSSLPSSYLTSKNIILFSILILFVAYVLFLPAVKFRRLGKVNQFQIQAQKLQDYYQNMYNCVNEICLGEEICGTCDGNNCLVGYTKNILLNAKLGKQFKYDFTIVNNNKDFDRSKVLESLIQTIQFLKDDWDNDLYKQIHIIKNNFEEILYNTRIDSNSYIDYLKRLETIDNKLKDMLER